MVFAVAQAQFADARLADGLIADGQNGEAQKQFAAANAAFQASDFPRALTLYEQCLALGMTGPALHFNIGVAAYRSGDYTRAENAFREVAQSPSMTALAQYNLGLVELKRGNSRAAREWFERVARADDERLRALAQKRLEENPAPASEWSLYGRASGGYDGNVALRSESIDSPGSGRSDTFAEMLIAGSYTFLPSWRIDGAAGKLDYASLDDFDQTTLSLGLARGVSLDTLYLEFGIQGAQFTLGGDVYERSMTASAQATRTFANRQSLQARVGVASNDGENEFGGLSGSRTELGLEYQWGWQSWSFSAHGQAEWNDTEDELFAYDWVELGADAKWAATPSWNFNAGASWRQTRYPAQSALQQPAWQDRRNGLRLEAARTLWKQSQLLLRYEHERSRSPVDANDYTRDWVALSIEFWR